MSEQDTLVMQPRQQGRTALAKMLDELPKLDTSKMQQIGSSGYYIETDEQGFKRIVQAQNVGKTTSLLLPAQLAVDEHNAKLSKELGLNPPARHVTGNSQLAGAYAVMQALKAKGFRPGSRVYRQLYRKGLKKAGVIK